MTTFCFGFLLRVREGFRVRVKFRVRAEVRVRVGLRVWVWLRVRALQKKQKRQIWVRSHKRCPSGTKTWINCVRSRIIVPESHLPL